MLTVGSLFAGIGGFDLGFERAGMRTLWQVEQNEFCRSVLNRHFPGAHQFEDVRWVTGSPERWAEHGGTLLEYVDVLCGGFPCQDISVANTAGEGIDGARSGLWSEYARLIGELRPRYVVVENVSALLVRGLGRVLGDLAALGYDAEWDCLPASAFGAPHQRDRIWLVAYPRSLEHEGTGDAERRTAASGLPEADMADAPSERRGAGLRGVGADRRVAQPGDDGWPGGRADWWAVEPAVGRVAYGVPARMDRLRALGNALVPQIAQWIGERIVAYELGPEADRDQRVGVRELDLLGGRDGVGRVGELEAVVGHGAVNTDAVGERCSGHKTNHALPATGVKGAAECTSDRRRRDMGEAA